MSSSALSVSTVAGTSSNNAPSTMAGAFISTPSPASLAASITVKLSGENYLFWRAQVGPLLRSHLLMGYVDGTNPCPAEQITVTTGETTTQQANPAYGRWVQTDQSILSAFVSSMTEGVVGMVLFAKTAREAWETLAGAFASTSVARSTGIRTQMADLKKNDLSINVYFHRMKALADTLASIGQPLRDEEFISYLLAGLDSDYDALYEVVNARTTPISIRDLFAQLQATEHRQAARRADLTANQHAAAFGAFGSTPVAAYGRAGPYRAPAPSSFAPTQMRSAPSSYSGSGGSGDGRDNRGRDGRNSRDNRGRDGRPRPTCQLCDTVGHIASRCYKRFNRDFLGMGNDGRDIEKQLAMAMAATGNGGGGGATTSYPVDPAWYADSGATHHLTHELEKLTTKEPYRGQDQVHAANGKGPGHEGNSA